MNTSNNVIEPNLSGDCRPYGQRLFVHSLISEYNNMQVRTVHIVHSELLIVVNHHHSTFSQTCALFVFDRRPFHSQFPGNSLYWISRWINNAIIRVHLVDNFGWTATHINRHNLFIFYFIELTVVCLQTSLTESMMTKIRRSVIGFILIAALELLWKNGSDATFIMVSYS